MKGFKIEEAFPDIKSNPYHWRVDPYEPNRVWFTIRTTATHTGPLHFGMSTYKATSARPPATICKCRAFPARTGLVFAAVA